MRVVEANIACKTILSHGALAFLATACFSYSVVRLAPARALTHFAFEFSQNIYFTSSLVLLLLWLWRLRNDPDDFTAADLVNVMSIYFGLYLGMHFLTEFSLSHQFSFNMLGPMLGAWLPLGCGFAVASSERS